MSVQILSNFSLGAGLVVDLDRTARDLRVVDFSNGGGDTITITHNGTASVLTEGVDFSAATSDLATAQSIAAAIDALPDLEAVALVADVAVWRTDGRPVTLASGDATAWTVGPDVADGTPGLIRRTWSPPHGIDGQLVRVSSKLATIHCQIRVAGPDGVFRVAGDKQKIIPGSFHETLIDYATNRVSIRLYGDADTTTGVHADVVPRDQ